MRVYSSVTQLIGRTPLLELTAYRRENGLPGRIFAKLEMMNPGGSLKDRIALAMVEDAERRGLIATGSTIIEPTSGNTGIGLAMVGAARGYRVILTMPDTMSVERRSLLRAYGAELVLTDSAFGMEGAIFEAQQLARQIPGSFIPNQFDNQSNPDVHYRTTGPEIWEDTEGAVDYFVAGVGTGGTLTGTGRFLKDRRPELKVIAVEPASSPLLSKGYTGPHGLQGLGSSFIPGVLDTRVYDEVIGVREEEAYAAARFLACREGVLAGMSSGAVLHAAGVIAARKENAEKRIVAILADDGARYLSTELFADGAW